jgi:hypothetical protein
MAHRIAVAVGVLVLSRLGVDTVFVAALLHAAVGVWTCHVWRTVVGAW